MNTNYKNSELTKNGLQILPPEFRLVSFISLSLKSSKFTEFTLKMQPEKIKSSNVAEDDRAFVFFILALMYGNEDMTTFVYKILEKLNDSITYDEFQKFEKKINKYITGAQAGGSKLKGLVNHLTLIGIFIFTAFYDYYIITNGTWKQMASTVTELQDISSRIAHGCGEYKPSKVAHFLAEYGTKDKTAVFSIDSTIQCLTTPSILSAKLEKVFLENNNELILDELQKNIQNLPGLEGIKTEPQIGTELVVFGQKNQEIAHYLSKKLLINNENNELDMKNLKLLAETSLVEFKKLIEGENINAPTSVPTQVPTSAPIFQRTSVFISDLTDAVSEIVPRQINSSLDLQNMFLYALQDSIRDIIRKKEDMTIDTQRYVEDLIRKASRLVDQLYLIPKILFFLLSINTTSFYIFVYFAKKIFKNRSASSSLTIEDADSLTIEDVNDNLTIEDSNLIKGGKKSKKRKTYKLKNKKNKTKHRKGKGKHFTKKYRK
jgi:hypothetical protein